MEGNFNVLKLQHNFNRLFVYGFNFVLLGIFESLIICLSIGILFAMIDLLKRAQGE